MGFPVRSTEWPTRQTAAVALYDWTLLLHGPKRDEALTLAEVRRYGADSFGDPDYIKIYGATPPECTAPEYAFWAAPRCFGQQERTPHRRWRPLPGFSGGSDVSG